MILEKGRPAPIRKIAFLLPIVILLVSFNKKPTSFVLDRTQLLTKTQAHTLDSLYKRHESKTSNEIVLLTVNSILPAKNLHDFGLKSFNEMGIGKKEKNNGVLIVLCMECREIQILTGRGTEKVLTDSIAKVIIDNTIMPQFRNTQFYEGLYKGSMDIITFLEKPGNKIK